MKEIIFTLKGNSLAVLQVDSGLKNYCPKLSILCKKDLKMEFSKRILSIFVFSIFICYAACKQVGSREEKTIRVRREKNFTCASQVFKSAGDTCTEDDVNVPKPILGNCTAYFKCAQTSGGLIEEVDVEFTTCSPGQIFDIKEKKCLNAPDPTTCMQIKCAEELKLKVSALNSTYNETDEKNAIHSHSDSEVDNRSEFTGDNPSTREGKNVDIETFGGKPDDITGPETETHQHQKEDKSNQQLHKDHDHKDDKSNSGSSTHNSVISLAAIVSALFWAV